MKPLGKKIQNSRETIEAYCSSRCSGTICSCGCNPTTCGSNTYAIVETNSGLNSNNWYDRYNQSNSRLSNL